MKTVIHYKAGSYLEITENWIYDQISNLKRYQPIVYSIYTENLNLYPVNKIRSLGIFKNKLGDLITFFNRSCNKLFHFYPYFYPYFMFLLKKDKPDLIHAHFGPSGYSFLKFAKILKLPLITTFYGYDLSMLPYQDNKWKIKYQRLFQNGDCFLVEGHYMKKCLIELGCPEKKVIVQHLGIALKQIKFVLRVPREDKKIYVLISGSFREKKGISYAIAAFGEVKKKYKNLYLTIIGDAERNQRSIKEKKKILSIINKYGLNSCTKMMGYQPHSIFLKELYKHHIFLSPSVCSTDGDTEGGVPVSIIEASASGMPIISTTHCDIPEVVINKESGYLVPERDIKALSDKIKFLAINTNLWKKMGQNGREHIEKNYSIIKQVHRLEKIYSKVLKMNTSDKKY